MAGGCTATDGGSPGDVIVLGVASLSHETCTFCPRPVESDPGALKLPFYHSNDDYDEMIFYHRGAFLSRDEIERLTPLLDPGTPTGLDYYPLARQQHSLLSTKIELRPAEVVFNPR